MSLLATVKSSAVVHLFLFYVFLVSGLILNFLMLCVLPIWYINRNVYRRLIIWMAYSHWSQLTWVTEWWSGSDCILYMDPEERKIVGSEHALVLKNHSYEIDWLMGWLMTERLGMLGASKVYAKTELRFAPLIGWTWHFAECIFLRRNWATDQHVITRQLTQLSDYPCKLAILMFPEGTRFTPDKLEASNKVALEKGYAPTRHTLLPRTRGFVLSMKSARKFMPCICDCTVVFPNSAVKPSITNILRGRPMQAAMYIRRIPIEDVPTDDEECARWLVDLFKKKDDIIEEYQRTGKLPGQPLPLKTRYYDLINFSTWSVILGIPILYLARYLITTAPWHVVAIVIGIFCALTAVVNKLISFTEIQNSSSYGKKETEKKAI